MECPNESQVAAVVGDVAVSVARGIVLDHIDDCASCRALLAGLVREDARAPDTWQPGQRVGRYVIGEPIGRGGMGAVWRAEDTELDRAVALKRLHRSTERGIFHEARTAAQLQHPNVVAVYDVVDDPHAPFLAMELVDGVTLTAWLSQARTWREIVAMVAQAGRGLAAAHARGLVHRDFKPDNVLVDRGAVPRARVADFGLAAVNETIAAPTHASCKVARVTASASGTPAYMAPELVDGAMPDVRSDVYAFAITLFEALHGQHPFAGTTVEMMWIEMAAGRIRDGGSRVPAWLERCVRRGLAVDPHDRWPDVASFVAAIDRASAPRRRYVVIAGLAGFGVAALAALAFGARGARSDCTAGAARVDQVWNPIARTALTAELVRGAPDGALARSTVRIVDRWASAWQTGRLAACTTTGEQRPARLTCLDHQLAELRSQLVAWSGGAATNRAVAAAAALPAASACDTAADSPFQVQPVVMRIGELKTMWRSGRAAEALPQLSPLLRDAETLGHHDTLALALVLAATIESETETGTAAEHANRAAIEAAKAGDDSVLYSALVLQAYARIDAGNPADALGICDAAEALSARGIPLPEKAVIAHGGALMRLGRTPEAIAQYRKAIAMVEPAAKTDPIAHISLGAAVGGLGNAYLESQDLDNAERYLERALELQEADYGRNHPEIARTLSDLGQAEASHHSYDAAAKHLQRARAILVGAYGVKHPAIGEADVALGNLASRQRHFEEARALFQQASTELAGALPADHLIFSVIEDNLGSIEQNADRAGVAISHYEKAYSIAVANHSGGLELARIEVDLAACLLDQGRFVDAKTRAEDTIEQLARANAPQAERAVPLMILALVADAKGDRAHAITLGNQVLALTTDDDSGSKAEARAIIRDKLRVWTHG